jgi:hypothetical protein
MRRSMGGGGSTLRKANLQRRCKWVAADGRAG